MANREVQSSPIRGTSSATFNKFSRYARNVPEAAQKHREKHALSRENRRKKFLEQVRIRADERTYQRRDMEGTLMKSSWDRDMRERELQKKIEGDAFFSESDIDDAAEILLEQQRQQAERAHNTAMLTQTTGEDEAMLDAMVQQQEQELDEMLTAYENPIEQPAPRAPRPHSPNFADDDEDYDALFMELASQENAGFEDTGMDMS